MPCNAVVYLPATIRQLDTTAMFANSATHTLAAKMLEATLTALLNNDNIGAYDYGTNITVESFYGTIRIWQDGKVRLTSPVSTGRSGYRTPKGEYVITNKYRNWLSTIYRVPMPYFMRLSCGSFGLHAGYVPGFPASHGCIRLPPESARAFFKIADVGHRVTITE